MSFFVATALLVGGVVAFSSVRGLFVRSLQDYQSRLLTGLEDSVGYSVSYRALSPSLLRAVEMQGVVIGSQEDPMVVVERLSLRVNLLWLLGFESRALPSVSAEIVNANIWIHQSRIEEAQESATDQGRTPDTTPDATPDTTPDVVENREIELNNINVKIRNATLHYRIDNADYVVEAIDADIALGGQTMGYSIRTAFSTSPQQGESDTGVVRGELLLEGESNLQERHGEARLELVRLSIGAVRVRSQSFGVYHDRNEIRVTSTAHHHPYQLEVRFLLWRGVLEATIESDQLVPATLLHESPFPPLLLDILESAFTVRVALSVDIPNSEGEYHATLEGLGKDSSTESDVEYAINVSGDLSQLMVHTFAVQTGSGGADFRGRVVFETLLVEGLLRFDDFSYRSASPLNGSIQIQPGSSDIVISSHNLAIGPHHIHKLRADIDSSDIETRINLFVALDEQELETASLVASLPSGPRAEQSITANLNRINPDRLAKIATALLSGAESSNPNDQNDQNDSYRLSTRVSVAIDNETTRINVPSFALTESASGNEIFTLWGSGTTEQFDVNNMTLRLNNRAVIEGSAALVRRESGFYDFSLNVGSTNYTYTIDVRYREGQFIRISGSHGIYGVVVLHDSSQYRFNIRSDTIPFDFLQSETNASLGFRLNGYWSSPSDWSLNNWAFEITLPQVPQYGLHPSALTLNLHGNQNQVAIRRLVVQYADVITQASGSAQFRDSEWRLDIASEENSLGEEYRINVGFNPSTSDLTGIVDIDNFSSERLNVGGLRGALDADINITLSDGQPNAVALLSGRELTFNALPLTFESELDYSDSVVRVVRFDVNFYSFALSAHEALFDIGEGRAVLELSFVQSRRLSIIWSDPLAIVDTDLPFFDLRMIFEAQFTQQTEDSGMRFEALTMRIEHVNSSNQSPASLALLPALSSQPFVFQLRRNGERFNIEGGYGTALDALADAPLSGWIDTEGRFDMAMHHPLPLQLHAEGELGGEYVDINIRNASAIVSQAPRLLDLGFLRFTDGSATGNARIFGPSSDIKMYGTFFARGARLLVSYVPYEIGPVNSFIVMQGNELSIARLFAPVGDESGAYFTARFVFGSGILTEFVIDIETPEGTTVPLAYDFNVLEVDAYASGNMQLLGNPDGLTIRGDIVGESGIVLLARTGGGGAQSADGGTPPVIDLTIRSGEQLELRWPSVRFPILRAFPQLGETITFRISENSNLFQLDGTVNFRSGEVFYYDRNFLIREGSVAMTEIGGKIDPLLNLRAEIRELATNGPVSIYLIIEDDFLSQLAPRLEAIPALTPAEIASLLGSNIYSSDQASSTTAANTAFQLAGDAITRLTLLNDFENSLRDLLVFFDLFTIRTQIFQNVLLDALNFGDPLFATNVNSITRYLNNTNLFLGKYWADYLYFEILIGLRSNQQGAVIPDIDRDLALDTEVVFELQSPVGVLRWNVGPEFEEGLRINSALELSWSFSY